MYYLGIDGGGTNSRMVAICENGDEIGRYTGGSTNLCSNSYDSVKNTINDLVNEFITKSGRTLADCKAFCIGSAGIDIPEKVAEMEVLLKEIGFTCPVKAVNDAELILAAQTHGGAGLAIISGTGSIGFAKDSSEKVYRCGGWGSLIDDGGSAYYIGMAAIRYALMSFDGRRSKTMLTDKIKEYFNIDEIDSVLNYIYTEDFNKTQIAKLALIVSQCAELGDETAIEIEEQAAAELASLAHALVNRSGIEAPQIVLSGSVVVNNTRIRNIFTRIVKESHPCAEISVITEKPEMGAIYLAKNMLQGE